LPNGYFLVFGGFENGFATSAVTQYDPNTVTIVDGATNQTRSLRSMNQPRAEFGWATDANKLSYAIGGEDNNGTPLATMEVYNPAANAWTYLASLPETLYGESAVSDGAGHLYAFGGVGANGAISNNVFRYTIATNTWDQVAAMQVGVRDSAALLASNGSIYVLGGKTAAGTTATVESYNIAANTWTLDTPLPQAVSSEAATDDSLGRIEVLGGNDANGNPTASIFVSQELTQADLAPTITTSAAKSAIVNSPYTYQVLSTGNPQATYALTTAPAGMSINASTGLISWTPNYATEGNESATVVASNRAGQSSQSFSIVVAPQTPTGLLGTSLSTTKVGLSWNASSDPNVTSYDIYKEYFAHSPRGSGVSIFWSLIASGITTNSATITGSGTFEVTAVNRSGIQSARSAPVGVAVWSPPDLYVATSTFGADISGLTLNVGQTGQIYLIQEFANPAPIFSVVSGPGGVSVDPKSGLVTYTPVVADIGQQPVVFAATNSAGTSQYTFYFDVLALNPTVALSGETVTYDGNPHAVSATAVGSDGVTPVAGSFAYTYDGNSTPPTAAGTYAVSVTFTSADPSYANASVTGSLLINPATPTIALSSGPFNYNGNAQTATATAVGIDGATPVAGNFQFTYDGGTTPPVGPGLFTVLAAFNSNDPNYASVSETSNEIVNSPGTQAPILTLFDGSANYDGNAHADSAGALGADGVTPVAGTFLFTYDGSSTAPTEAGSYAVVAIFISSDVNYANATITGTMTISAVTPTVGVDPNPFTFDGTSHAALVTALGVDQVTPVDGTLDVTYDGSATPPVDAGTYTVAATFTSNDPNYLSTSTTSSLTILPATPSVGIGNGGQWEFTYNGTPQSIVGSAVGIDGLTPINGTFTYVYSQYYYPYTQLTGAPVGAGDYSFTEYFTSLDPNYSDGSFSFELLIYPAVPTVNVSGGTFTYNGAGQTATVTVVGIDGVTPVVGTTTLTYNGSDSAPSLPGTYAVDAAFASGDPNYASWSGSATLVINKATPSLSGLSSPVVTVAATAVTVSGHITAGSAAPGGDDVAITLDGVTQPATVRSSGSFSATFNIQGLATGTYPISFQFLGDATRFNAAAAASSTLTVQAAPTILTNPASQTVVSGSSVTFSASASGNPVPTVQWQVSTNGGSYFKNLSGATGTSLTLANMTSSQNGYLYRAVFHNSAGSATTAAATLTVQFAPTVTRNPTSQAAHAGQNATLTAAATGNPVVSVQWQVSTNGGTSYGNITGANSPTLALTGVAGSQNGYRYRAVFTNSLGSATTTAATLTVL